MVEVIAFPTPKSKVVFDYRSGVTVLACDSTYDVAEPHASELEDMMMRREIGFGHAWRLADVSTALMRELDRIGLPMRVVGGVAIMPKDFRVIGELPPNDVAFSEPTRLAA